jgi:molybdenum cofactor cytidylyltransferase
MVELNLHQALRFDAAARLALVGGGGKTTAMFQLARQCGGAVIVTVSTHLSVEQTALADRHIVLEKAADLEQIVFGEKKGDVLLVTGPVIGDRVRGPAPDLLEQVHIKATQLNIPIIIEADGSRCLPIKAPAVHEPDIPNWVNYVVYVVGLSGLYTPIDEKHVHRYEIFLNLSGQKLGDPVSIEALAKVLCSPEGGLKNIPNGSRRGVLLNQADTLELQSTASVLAKKLLSVFDTVVIASMGEPNQENCPGQIKMVEGKIHAVYEPAAAVILAAGLAKRMGSQPKPLFKWQGESFIRRIIKTIIQAEISPVLVVVGAFAEQISTEVADLPVEIVFNPDWQNGQSTSIIYGLSKLPKNTGSVVFLQADQPLITTDILLNMQELHRQKLNPIIAPVIGDKRTSPVLFDRCTFASLAEIKGDVGGRAIFSKFLVTQFPWHDERLAFDIDTPEDYQRLIDGNL